MDKRLLWKSFAGGLFMFLSISLTTAVMAQVCPQFVNDALANLDEICAETGRNQACYGNAEVNAQPQPGVSTFQFERVGDIEAVSSIRALSMSQLDMSRAVWGVALMRLQANLPDALPGENVTFLLVGDVEIVDAIDPANNRTGIPMRSFYLRTGIGAPECSDAPNGLLVRTPRGRGQITFSVNGVDVAMGSTVLFQAEAGAAMTVSTIEGAAAIRSGTQVVPVIAGTADRSATHARMGCPKASITSGMPFTISRPS